MNELLLKSEFLNEINYLRFLIDIIVLFLTTKTIEIYYNRYIISNDNKVIFSSNMFFYTLSIFLIVSVIKSSIALSLGLVGALSIIRFRTAVKEANQLITLLLLTAISISIASEQEVLAILVTIIYVIQARFTKTKQIKIIETKILTIASKESIDLNQIKNFKTINRLSNDYDGNINIEYYINDIDEVEEILKYYKSIDENIEYEIS